MRIHHKQNTKIIATVGPASQDKQMLKSLIEAGVDIFRLNFSHGSYETHKENFQKISELNAEMGDHIGILADLQGPKLRVGKVQEGGIPLSPGDEISFVGEECIGTADKVYMGYEHFASDVEAGERVLCDDGKLVFEVIETDSKSTVKLKVIYGGILKSNKGVNLPAVSYTHLTLPTIYSV